MDIFTNQTSEKLLIKSYEMFLKCYINRIHTIYCEIYKHINTIYCITHNPAFCAKKKSIIKKKSTSFALYSILVVKGEVYYGNCIYF